MTRMYFPDEPSNDEDPVLSLVPAGRRHTLIARRTGNAEAAKHLEWNIVLQGENETVFFDLMRAFAPCNPTPSAAHGDNS